MRGLSALPGLPRAALLLAILPALGGCFHPLYASVDAATGRNVGSELQAIAVDPIPDRIGHYLGNELIFALNGSGDEVAPRYRLTVTTHEAVQTALIDTLQARATAGTLIVYANYLLVPAGGGPPITSGLVTETATYDRSAQRFANVRAARDAEIRAAQAIADQIKTRIAAALATRS
ncbi:MAG: hypothetical protein JO163_20940 [Methylobacteriaceae bacterium]|nr:hypothetical protein [Methylobacteriaceae bacterium]MBV9633114.1 hypothetical protein [Methylobacteriaceae bacterium]MBV9705196.1 hypothetical protein [Methylobacteriaceae bacterium]